MSGEISKLPSLSLEPIESESGPAMRCIMLTTFLLLAMTPCVAGENYVLEIGGDSYSLGLNKEKKVTLPDGTHLRLKLSLKEYIEYQGRYFSFSHRNSYRPTNQDLGDGIFQTTVITALGTTVIVQEYTELNPSGLVDIMIQELTKEEVDYGYELKKSDVSKTIGKKELRGKEAVTSYKGAQWTRSVYVYGARDEGLLIVTIIEEDNVENDMHVIRDFWRTLKVSLE